jgi:hypothetical protein
VPRRVVGADLILRDEAVPNRYEAQTMALLGLLSELIAAVGETKGNDVEVVGCLCCESPPCDRMFRQGAEDSARGHSDTDGSELFFPDRGCKAGGHAQGLLRNGC